MQIKKYFIILSITLASTVKADSMNCKAVQWPFSDSIQNLTVNQLQSINRTHLYAYLYFELSNPTQKRKSGLAQKLIWFLKSSEPSIAKSNLLEAINWAADLDSANPTIYSIKELCALENQIQKFNNVVK